jgi:hypothetical protein
MQRREKRFEFFWLLMVWSALSATAVSAQQETARLELPIRYLTREALYFSAGTADGIRSGDSVAVVRSGRIIARLEVKFVAEHSSSCLLANVEQEIHADDRVVWSIPRSEFVKRTQPAKGSMDQTPAVTSPVTPMPRQAPRPTVASPRRRSSRSRSLSGQLSVQTLLQRDNSASQYDFLEPSAYLRLRAERIGNVPLQLNFRLRTRRNYRTNPLSNNLEHQQTINRLYEISLAYAPEQSAFELAAGRMLRNEIRGLGYLDGVAAAYKIKERVKAGIFLGSEPELYRSSFQFQQKKIGGFANIKTELGANSELSSTVTAIGHYSRQQLSREFLALQNDLSINRRFYVSQYLEMDLNRSWRRDMESGSVSISDLFLNATYYAQPSLSFNIAYDARKNIRTWESHNIADSLFDDALRQGLHVGAQIQPLPTLRISVNGGLRTAANSENVYSGSLAVTQSNLFSTGIGLSGRFSYYGNSLSKGYYPSADISWRLLHRLNGSIGAGAYIYQRQPMQQTNLWERLRLDFNLTNRVYCSGTFENFHGDSMKFIRAFIDMGVRF